jgi:SulP family sulfate permease
MLRCMGRVALRIALLPAAARADLVAGLAAAAIVLPKAMAYATIAGLPIEIGLFTVLLPMLAYAALGSSRPLSVSTTTTLAILTGAALGGLGVSMGDAERAAATATLALLVGVLLCAASVLRFGFVGNFISAPVLVGFKSGIALVIVVDQLPKLLGLHIAKQGFLRDLASIASHLLEVHPPTLLLGGALIAGIFACEHWMPRLPVPLVAVAAAIGGAALLRSSGVELAMVGAVPTGLPHFVAPSFAWVEPLWPAACGIALMSFTESIAAARAFAGSGEPRPRPNRELLALGVANLAGGVLGAMPAGGGTSQTAVNQRAGARSQLAAVVTALVALGALLFLGPLLALLPQTALAAIVIAYSVELIRPAEFRAILAVRGTEFAWALVALAGVVLIGTLQGIVCAVFVSLLALAHQAYHSPVYTLGRKRGTQVFRPPSAEHPDDETWPGLLILRIEGRLFFANAPMLGERIQELVEAQRPGVLLLDASAVFDIEYTALEMLNAGERKLAERGVELWIAALNPSVRRVVESSELGRRLGRERMFFNVQQGVDRYERRRGERSSS